MNLIELNNEYRYEILNDFIGDKLYLQPTNIPHYKCCFPGWDNAPRKAWIEGSVFALSFNQYKIWLTDIIQWTKNNYSEDERYVYINAWNEWGEGAVLEPTVRYGYKNLQIIKNILESN